MKIEYPSYLKILSKICKMNQDQLRDYLEQTLKKSYEKVIKTEDYVYAEGDIPIALVAHMDTVFFEGPPKNIYYDSYQSTIWSPQGLGADDRAGVFAILNIIHSGFRPHVIFAANEELGVLGATKLGEKECPFEDLKFIIELDRRGSNDCVFYDCNNPEFEIFISSFGFETATGIFSDISALCPAWGIAGVNLSIGYYNEHSKNEFLKLDEMYATIKKVETILSQNSYKKYEYVPIEYQGSQYFKCDVCGKYFLGEEMDLVQVEGYDDYVCCCKQCGHFSFCDECGVFFETDNPNDNLCPDCELLRKGGFI